MSTPPFKYHQFQFKDLSHNTGLSSIIVLRVIGVYASVWTSILYNLNQYILALCIKKQSIYWHEIKTGCIKPWRTSQSYACDPLLYSEVTRPIHQSGQQKRSSDCLHGKGYALSHVYIVLIALTMQPMFYMQEGILDKIVQQAVICHTTHE